MASAAPRRPVPGDRFIKQPPKFIHPSLRNRTSSSFTPFKRLPLELRLKIWQATFPGPRKVRLDFGVLNSIPTKLPVTLFIDHESRTETLRNYTIVFPTDIFDFDSDPITPPFCYNPSTDSLFCMANTVLYYDPNKMFPKWQEYVGTHLPGGLNSILELEIIWTYPDNLQTSSPTSFKECCKPVEDMLSKLGGLTRLSITVFFPHHKDKVEHALGQFLQENKDNYVSHVLPKLAVVLLIK